MIGIVLLAAAASAAAPVMPPPLRGEWDLPSRCQTKFSDSRLIIRTGEAVFVELVFTPKRILNKKLSAWEATGQFNESGEVFEGRLALHLGPNGRSLSYVDANNRTVRLTLCARSVS